MTNSIRAVDIARRRLRLRQEEVASELGITQGHYSKLLNRRAPLTDMLDERLVKWLSDKGQSANGDATAERMHALATSIRDQCMELMQLAERSRPTS